MQEVLAEFHRVIKEAERNLIHVDEKESAVRAGVGRWSKKEIVGHLIDSASNNHQRFVRAQQEEVLRFPAYNGDRWVELQQYQEQSWHQLVQLWTAYNRHLLHVMRSVPEDKLKNQCWIGNNDPINLGDLMADYVVHLKHHLQQILENPR